MYGPMHSSPFVVIDGIAGFVGPLEYLKSLSAKGKHFRHERKSIELPLLVERPQDVFSTADLHPFSRSQAAFTHEQMFLRVRTGQWGRRRAASMHPPPSVLDSNIPLPESPRSTSTCDAR
jgi:hypothetical protein